MSNYPKPIETSYAGYRFRSRLEARWAVFFDALGIPWEYEKEGFDVDGIWYLPDFYLPEFKIFAEVKPGIFSKEDYSLVAALNGLVLDGLPEIKIYALASSYDACDQIGHCCYACYITGKFGGIDFVWSAHKKRLWFDYDTGNPIDYFKSIEAVRSARFEFGENPRP